jgi:hypothetical protein
MLYDSHLKTKSPPQADPHHLAVRILPGGSYRKGDTETFIANQPALTQIMERIAKRSDQKAVEV